MSRTSCGNSIDLSAPPGPVDWLSDLRIYLVLQSIIRSWTIPGARLAARRDQLNSNGNSYNLISYMISGLFEKGTGESYFLALCTYRPRLVRIVEIVCPFLSVAEKEEALDFILEKMEQDDFSRLRKYNPARAKAETFMNLMARNLLIDYVRHLQGKRVMYKSIQSLDALHRKVFVLKFWEGYKNRELGTILLTRFGIELSDAEIDAVLQRVQDSLTDLNMWKLAEGSGTRVEIGESNAMDDIQQPEGVDTPEDLIADRQESEKKTRAAQIISRTIAEMPSRDKFIIVSRFHDNMPVPKIAEMLECDPMRVYRQLRNLLEILRSNLEKNGIHDFTDYTLTDIENESFLDELKGGPGQ